MTPAAALVKRHSGLQRQVLALYRDVLRGARALTVPRPARASAAAFARADFRAKATSVEGRDYLRIEHLLRTGRKQLAALKGAQVSGFGTAGGADGDGSGGGAVGAIVGWRRE